jgi:predicted metal-dependent peptidase
VAASPLARERIGRILERWFLTEPLLFSLWNDHRVTSAPVATIRVGTGVIAYNPEFIDGLTPVELEAVMHGEAVRILLKHPYSRRLLPPQIAWQASNLTLREHLGTLPLPFLRAVDVFGHHDHDQQFYEFYHHRLLEQAAQHPGAEAFESAGAAGRQSLSPIPSPSREGESSAGDSAKTPSPLAGAGGSEGAEAAPTPLDDYAHSPRVGLENTRDWDEDELFSERIDERVTDAELNRSWGTLPGAIRLRVLANRQPRLDYRSVLRLFHRSVLSRRRHLTRMKPSRRYGFLYMGSRYDFTTRLLVAVDVSGSMTDDDIRLGFSLVNRFFQYGIDRIDAIAFDTQVQGEALTLERARREIRITGRGGTNFNAVIDYVDAHPGYDGVLIFTDGVAPAPRPPGARRIPLLWVFIDEKTYQAGAPPLRALGRVVFLKNSQTG